MIMSSSSKEINEGGYGFQLKNSTTIWEIEEEEEEEEEAGSSEGLYEINHGGVVVPMESIKEDVDEGSLFSLDVNNGHSEDSVYVAVGKKESSVDALSWTLKHSVNRDTMIYLIHVFPEMHLIPSPLGMLPKRQVSPEQVESYMAEERGRRRELLQKYISMCSSSQMKVDTMLIESDAVGKAILDLIPILNIKKLVVGSSKGSARKLKNGRGNGIVDQILQNPPETCDVKVICEGKEVFDQMMESFSPRVNEESRRIDSFPWSMCFKPKFSL
ncbi:Usp domain-containing protein [Cephalotus follicularis]|uniref:Usp domain-containing protein n=1 Tax=Cephalotus follicularis TaxID=3775 RepID=A0A1Q3D1W3_CEPFO|nr:Usp domain-containing protein [Cephalotus follicularis]